MGSEIQLSFEKMADGLPVRKQRTRKAIEKLQELLPNFDEDLIMKVVYELSETYLGVSPVAYAENGDATDMEFELTDLQACALAQCLIAVHEVRNA